jgi:hypothetical protein
MWLIHCHRNRRKERQNGRREKKDEGKWKNGTTIIMRGLRMIMEGWSLEEEGNEWRMGWGGKGQSWDGAKLTESRRGGGFANLPIQLNCCPNFSMILAANTKWAMFMGFPLLPFSCLAFPLLFP